MSQRFERRDFLKGVLASLAFVPPLASLGCSDDAGQAPMPHKTTGRALHGASGFFDDDDLAGAALIAQKYLAAVAPNAAQGEIDALVAPTAALLDRDDDNAVLADLRARITTDFSTAATAVVDGWTFAATELQLCVLARTLAS